ncbi:MAG: hypothetical protein WAV48_06675, partial [Candidatus Magasanikiibacteriota bacterium]
MIRNKSPTSSELTQVPLFTPTPTPLPNIKKFLILPNNYQIELEDINAIKTSAVDYVFLDNPSQDYTTSTKGTLNWLIVE